MEKNIFTIKYERIIETKRTILNNSYQFLSNNLKMIERRSITTNCVNFCNFIMGEIELLFSHETNEIGIPYTT